jgi:hypothetical protein
MQQYERNTIMDIASLSSVEKHQQQLFVGPIHPLKLETINEILLGLFFQIII